MAELDLMLDRARERSNEPGWTPKSNRDVFERVAEVFREFSLEISDETRTSLEGSYNAFISDEDIRNAADWKDFKGVVGTDHALGGFLVLAVEDMVERDG